MQPLSAGSLAPDFSLSDQDGNQVRLADLRGKKVLVYFYPKAMTPGCTTQACGLRDVNTGTHPIVFRTNMEAGHGGKSGRFQRYHELAEAYAFVLSQLDVAH